MWRTFNEYKNGIFQDRGRPQGNINKKGSRGLPKSIPKMFKLLKIFKSIEKNLIAKGMTISDKPDLLVNISTKSSENIYIDNSYYSPYSLGWYPYYGRSYRRVSHTTSEGVLYIDIIDTNSKQLVWQGKGIGFLSSHKMNRDELVEGYVNKILSVYPPEEVLASN